MPEPVRAWLQGCQAALLGGGTAALLGGLDRVRGAPGEHDGLPALLALVGLLLARSLPRPRGATGAPPPGGTLAALALAPALLGALSGLLPLPAEAGRGLAGLAALLGGGLAGAAAGGSAGTRQLGFQAAAGAALALTLAAVLPEVPWSGAPLLALAAAGLGLALAGQEPVGEEPRPAVPVPALGLALAGLSGLRLGLALQVGAAALAFLGPAPWARAAAALALGLSGGLWLARHLPRGLGAWVAAEALGGGALLLLGRRLPLGGLGELWLLLLLGGLLGGVALAGPLRAGGARGLALAALAPLLIGSAWGPLAAGWTEAERVALATGSRDPGAGLAQALEAGQVLLRWERLGPPSVHVVEVRQPALRLLFVDGRPRGAVPAGREGPAEEWGTLLAAPVLQGALSGCLAGEGPLRVVGLGTGVSLEPALRAAPGRVTVLEPAPGARQLLDDPGDPFGLANGHLGERRAAFRLLARGARAGLLAAPTGPVVFDAPDPDPSLVALACTRGPTLVRLTPDGEVAAPGSATPARAVPARPFAERLRALAALGPAWAFAPGPGRLRAAPGELVLLLGPAALDAGALVARAEAAPVASALGAAGLAPVDLLATCVADPAGVERAVAAGAEDLPAVLQAGADGDGPALGLPADPQARASLLLDLAQAAGRRRLPAALPWTRRALAERRDARTLVAWGDLLYRARREEEAQAAWREALALDPEAQSARISLATDLRNRRDLAGAAATLREGLRGDPARDAPLHYLLGELLEVQGDDAAAAEAFLRAGALRDAAERARAARERTRGRTARPLSARDRLAAARELLARGHGVAPAEAEARRLEALELVLPLADEPGLSPDERRQTARLLERLAAGEPLPALRHNVHRRAAAVLAPLPEPRDALERARHLIQAADPAAAEALLRPQLEGPLAARAHLVLGEALRAQERAGEAVAAWERGLALAPPTSADAWALEAIAEVERARGRPERALTALDAAERLVPGLPRVRLSRARLLEELGRPGDALAAWRAVLEVAGPADPARQEAGQRIQALEARLAPR